MNQVTKICTKCGVDKLATVEFFGKQKDGKCGLRADCKLCKAARGRAYYRSHREEDAARGKAYRNSHKEELADYNKIYYELNKDEIAIRNKTYYESNKDEIATRNKAYYESHKEEARAYIKAYQANLENKERRKERHDDRYKTDTQYRLSYNIHSSLYLAIKRNWKSGKTVGNLGCSIEFLKRHLESQFQSGMSWENWGRGGWEIDHIRPRSSFDLTNHKQVLKCCHWTNLQPLWKEQNMAKGSKYSENG